MKFGILVFPGTNGDRDCYKAVSEVVGESVEYVWHAADDLSQYDCIIVPGGSTYGDYLRPGALASKTNVVQALMAEAGKGKYILGIGNGFQILLESGLLPGAVLTNESEKFQCQQATVRVVNNHTPFTVNYEQHETIRMPIAHRTGNYVCDEATLSQLESNGQIIFEYEETNPNGSARNIAGVSNEQGNIVGLMPHPERAVNERLGSEDGSRLFTSILKTWREKHGAAVNG